MGVQNKEFRLTEEHCKLLSELYVRWNNLEFGAPTINPKNPYGCSSNREMFNKMRRVLDDDKKECPDCGYAIESDYTDEDLRQLYEELETALQIVLVNQKFDPGVYRADEYGKNWKKVGE